MKFLKGIRQIAILNVLVFSILLLLVAYDFTQMSTTFEYFWMWCHEVCTRGWMRILQWCGEDEYVLFVWGLIIYSNTIFIIFNAPYIFMDLTEKPEFLTKYKIQEGKNNPLTGKDLWRAIKVIFPNNTFSQLAPLAWYYLMKWRGIDHSINLPTFQRVIIDLAMCGLLEEIFFYYSHRLLHLPLFYKRIHKLHHEWTAPISLTCVYAHPIETLISNTIPVLLSPLVVGSHFSTWLIWIALAFSWTIKDHSGYHFPFFPSTEAHDYHHLKFNQNYGVLGILDWLHGTDAQYKKTVQFQRDHAFFSIKSARERIPDTKKRE